MIFNVRIDVNRSKEVRNIVRSYISHDRSFHHVVTVNPEILLQARADTRYRDVLNASDLAVVDGIGVAWALRLQGIRGVERYAGADLMEDILCIANEHHLRVFLAARSDGLSTWQHTRDVIMQRYSNLEISGVNVDVYNGKSLRRCQLSTVNCQLILCNFGAPDQEYFLAGLRELPNSNIRLTMGVGGSFDYLTGAQRRAPQWLRTLGLEWVWRLIRQPSRWRRIWRAVVVFPVAIIMSGDKHHDD